MPPCETGRNEPIQQITKHHDQHATEDRIFTGRVQRVAAVQDRDQGRVAMVLVIDRSGSMADDIYHEGAPRRHASVSLSSDLAMQRSMALSFPPSDCRLRYSRAGCQSLLWSKLLACVALTG